MHSSVSAQTSQSMFRQEAAPGWKIPAMHWLRVGACVCVSTSYSVSALLIRLICYFIVCRVVTECGGESKLLIHSFSSRPVALC